MTPSIEELLSRIQTLQEQMEQEYAALRAQFEQQRQALADRFVELQRQQRVGLWRYLRGSRWSVVLTAPIIYAGWPVFALLDAAFIAAVLRWVWRQGDRYEEIALDERNLEVRRSTQAEPAFRAHPYWVRLSVDGGEGRERVLLGSQGRQVEVGAFLSNEERRDLAVQLKGLLASAAGRDRNENHTLG